RNLLSGLQKRNSKLLDDLPDERNLLSGLQKRNSKLLDDLPDRRRLVEIDDISLEKIKYTDNYTFKLILTIKEMIDGGDNFYLKKNEQLVFNDNPSDLIFFDKSTIRLLVSFHIKEKNIQYLCNSLSKNELFINGILYYKSFLLKDSEVKSHLYERKEEEVKWEIILTDELKYKLIRICESFTVSSEYYLCEGIVIHNI
ncbi:MAG: hypothetical protein GY795_37410, partial [Desulfobacterales bacterium]|nr:hypothetical protein [Desulfobacterales bacterium]